MASEFDTNRKSFNFIWILENFEYCGAKVDELFSSPKFIVDTIERAKWSLRIYPRGYESEGWISLFLRREGDSKGPPIIELDYELAFLASDGSVLSSLSVHKYAFPKSQGYGFLLFEKRESVFAKRSTFLPQDTLTVRCRMWKNTGEVKRNGKCIARTRVGVEKKIFIWKMLNFSTICLERELTFRLKATSDDKPIMALKLFLRNNKNSTDIQIKFVNSNQAIVFSTFKSSLVNARGDYVKCGDHEFWFSPSAQNEEITLPFSKDALMNNNSLYLPNDVLTLYCEQAFSTGVVLEGIESTSYGCLDFDTTHILMPENLKNINIKTSDSETPSDLKFDLSSMLQENVLCDVKLCSESETFPAHWFILSARSPVFRAMFKSDMKERARDRIDIEDLKPDTIRRMLLYMYTDSLEELQWDIASDLYVAAEKYQIMTLKNKCCSFLKTNLSLTNACEILLLADLHQDKDLKSIVQDFVLKNDKSIINSDEWKLLMQANVHLAAETMLLRFKE